VFVLTYPLIGMNDPGN